MFSKSRITTLAAATVVALTLAGLGVSAIAATSAKNNAATGYVVCVSKTTGDMKLRTKSTCPAGFTTKVFGAKGPAGLAGAAGITGAQGPAGIAGPQGPAGSAGAQGSTGDQGMKGDMGDMGEMGMPGAPGEQGPQGEQGIQGLPGRNGLSEVYYSSGWHVALNDASGVTSLTSLTLPAGTYLVTASSTFENDGSQTPESWVSCWVENQDGAIQVSGESRAVAPITMVQPYYLNEVATLTFKCAADYSIGSIGAKAPSLSAIKVDQLNWQF